MLKPIIITSVVVFVILTECCLAYLLIPSNSKVEAWAKAQQAESEAAEAGGEKKADDGHGSAGEHAAPAAHAPAAKPASGGHGAAKPAAGGHGAAKPAAGGHGAAKPAAGGHGAAKPAAGGHGAPKPAAGGHGAAKPEKKPASSGEHGGNAEMEVDLGKFNIVIHQPGQNVTLRVNFHLISTVLESDEEEASTLFAQCEHRLRDQILFEIRNSTVADLTDPGLGLIKRKILAKTNELLGQPIVKTIVFSDFTFIEQ